MHTANNYPNASVDAKILLSIANIQGVPKRYKHTLNNCKPDVYYYLFNFEHVKELKNIIPSFCHCQFSKFYPFWSNAKRYNNTHYKTIHLDIRVYSRSIVALNSAIVTSFIA